MKDLDERIYELLESKKGSLSINEISESISDSTKQDITRKLLEMNRQGIVYKKIKEGKAYYSINSKDGEGRNASQENINNINKVFAAFGNKQALNDMGVFNKIENELGIDENSNILEDVEVFNKLKIDFIDFDLSKLEYKKNIFFENETYKMSIPDSFKYLPNEEDRDFIAYLPKTGLFEKMPYNEGGANIIIYSSTLIPFSDNKARIEETKRMLYDIVFWNGGYIMFERYGGKPEYKAVDLKSGRTGVIYMKFDTAHNFYFTCCLKNGFKQMRIVIDGINGSKEDLEQIAISLMNKFEVKEDLSDFKELNDEMYLSNSIDNKLIEKWVTNIKGIHSSLNEYFKIFTKLESLKINVMNSKGTFNIVKFKSEIREELKKYSLMIDKHIKNGEEFINHIENLDVDKKILIPAYYSYYKFLDQKEFTINLDDGSAITQKVDLAEKTQNKIFNKEILKMISNYSDKDYKESDENDDNIDEVNNELKEYCDGFIKQARKNLKRLRSDWEFTEDEYQKGLNSKVIESEYELKWEIKNIKQAARAFGHKYDDFLTELDVEGKKLLKQGADYLFIDEINKIIKDVFDAFSDLHLSFNTHGSAYWDLGTFDYDIPDELNDIKYWWKREYEKNPTVIKMKEKELKAREEKELQKKEKNDELLSILSSDLQKEKNKYKKEITEIQDELNSAKQEIKLEIEEQQKKEIKQLTDDKNDIISDLKKNLELLKKENKQKEEELSTLGFMKFMQKDKLKTEIDINNQNIEKYNEQIKNVDKDFNKEYENIVNKFEKDSSNRIELLEKTFKMPLEPEKVIEKVSNILSSSSKLPTDNSPYITSIQKENNRIMEIIYEQIVDFARPVTIPELMNSNDDLGNCSNQKISALLKRMTDSKCLIKVIDKGKSYFSVGEEDFNNSFIDNKTSSDGLIDKNNKNSYSKDRYKIYKLLESEENIDPLKFEKNKELSKLRLYQLLFSLESDGLALKRITDSGIIFYKR